MKSEQWIGKKGAWYWYYRFRDSEYYSLILIGITVAICFMLIFSIIIPQVGNWFSIRDEIVATRSRIALLQNNISFVNNLNRNQLNTQVQSVTSALPVEKDFSSMLDVITNAAITTGISLNDYTFQVGSLGASDGSLNNKQLKDLASVRITLVVSGSLDQVKRFISKVETSAPVAEVVNIDGNDQTVALSIQFYQKSFPKITINDDKPLSSLPADKLSLLQKISAMNRPVGANVLVQTSSSSASPLPLF